MSNLLEAKIVPPKIQNPVGNYQNTNFYVNTIEDKDKAVEEFWKNEEIISRKVTPFPVQNIPIIITPNFNYESWNNFEKQEIKNIVKTTTIFPDTFWRYFENKDNPSVENQNPPRLIYNAQPADDINTGDWKRNLDETKGHKKLNRTKEPAKIVILTKESIKKDKIKIKKTNREKPVKKIKNKISFEDIVKSGALNQISKSERQKILQLFKEKSSGGKINEKICKEIPAICKKPSRLIKGSIFLLKMIKLNQRQKTYKKFPFRL